MAFKRDADIKEWLSLLKRRRVAELFAEDVPENEALLMKNGRFCCMVCAHRPIFDTAQMLAHHRQGKKHAQFAEALADSKLEIENVKQKRRHEQYTQGTEVSKDAPSSGSRKHHPLLTAKKYQPTVKKSKLKPNERRPVLQLDSAIGGAQTVAEYQRMRGQHQDSVDVKPYVSKKQLPSSFTGDGAITSAPRHNGTCSQWSVPKMTEQFEKPTQEPVSNPASSGSTQACIRQKSKHKHKGWKKSLDGTWVRDEDVEFDSDEEPPDLP